MFIESLVKSLKISTNSSFNYIPASSSKAILTIFERKGAN
jgi:hypothetical protein